MQRDALRRRRRASARDRFSLSDVRNHVPQFRGRVVAAGHHRLAVRAERRHAHPVAVQASAALRHECVAAGLSRKDAAPVQLFDDVQDYICDNALARAGSLAVFLTLPNNAVLCHGFQRRMRWRRAARAPRRDGRHQLRRPRDVDVVACEVEGGGAIKQFCALVVDRGSSAGGLCTTAPRAFARPAPRLPAANGKPQGMASCGLSGWLWHSSRHPQRRWPVEFLPSWRAQLPARQSLSAT